MKPNRTGLLIAIGAAVFLVLIVLFSSIYVIDEREQAVILQFGKPVASRTEPGLYFKAPFIQEVRRLPKTLQYWHSGADRLTDLPTADGKKIEVSAWAVWRITDPRAFIEKLRTMKQGEGKVMVLVRSTLRDVITAHDLEEVVRSTERDLTYSLQTQFISEVESEVDDPAEVADVSVAQPGVSGDISVGRLTILDSVSDNVAKELKTDQKGRKIERGVELVEVGISNIEFVPRVREAAFDRQRAFMESIAAGYTNAGLQRKQEIINAANAEAERLIGEGEREASIIRGEADAKNISLFAKAIKETGDFYQFVRTLEVYQESLQGETRLIMTTGSDLLRLLNGMEPAKLPKDAPSEGGETVAVEARVDDGESGGAGDE